MVKIAVSGALGRMGQRIMALAGEDKDLEVACGFERQDHPDLGSSSQGVLISNDYNLLQTCDCMIDFTLPSATIDNVSAALKNKKAFVIGTTGLSATEIEKLKEAAKDIPVVYSPNMSVGVNLLFKLVSEAAKILKTYSAEIEEAHHIHKKDAPSGTAKKIAQLINEHGFSIKDEDVKAIREGEIIGDHKIVFDSEVDTITLSHSAKTRDIFAKGALIAAKWVVDKPAGLYSMADVLF